MAYDNVILEKKNNVAVLTLNRPPANAVNLGIREDVNAALDEVENDKDIRVLVITGAGEKGFSAGFDVTDAGNLGNGPEGAALWTRIDRFCKPTIAAINGFALGGGCELALACTFRIMVDAPKAKIGLTELNLGIIPGWGGTQRLPRVVGKANALDMILFSRRLVATEAYEIGLVNKVSEPGELMSDALEFAEKLAQRPPLAVGAVLKAVSEGLEEGIDHGLKVEADGIARVQTSKDAAEGFTAFLEKRDPAFIGE